MAEYDSELHKYKWNNEIIETQKSWNHIWIHEILFKSDSETHYCVATISDLLNTCVRDKK